HQLLVAADAVHVGGVEHRDAELERAMDGLDRLLVVAAAVEIGHAHAAQTDRGDLEPGTQLSLLHVKPPATPSDRDGTRELRTDAVRRMLPPGSGKNHPP